MDIRSIQKTGNMHYLYLPKVWCKENKINSRSKVSLLYNEGGVLSVFPCIYEEKPKNIDISINDANKDSLQKLIVALYINTLDSFKIRLTKDMDLSKVMEQKRVISLESIEFDKDIITCDSVVSIRDPGSLLKTMLKKAKNIIVIMLEKNPNKELLQRYEEEIDKSALLIEKAIINHYSFISASKLKSIDLHYISWISRLLEQTVDELIVIDKERGIKKSLLLIIDDLCGIIENVNNLDYKIALQFIKKSNDNLKYIEVKDSVTHSKQRIKQLMNNVCDIIIDWAITKEIEKS